MGVLDRLRRRRRDPDVLACREFVELVTDYFEDALGAGERARFEEHLAACDGCEEYLDQVRATVRTLGEVTPVLPPPDPETRDKLLVAFRELRDRG
jgi:anti-sigma factor RsiW